MRRLGRPAIDELLKRYGRPTFAEEVGIEIPPATPSALFRLLCFALLASARISAAIAVRAARGLSERGWLTPEQMGGSTWEDRVEVLDAAGYARYDVRTATMLGEAAELAMERYHGDLRDLRRRAKADPASERELLKEFKGIGDVGADIFCREAQAVWDELYPFADRVAIRAADRLGLPADARDLAAMVWRQDFVRLVDALVRLELARDRAAVLVAVMGKGKGREARAGPT